MRARRPAAVALTAILGVGLTTALPATSDPATEHFWPQWRGPYATGVSRFADPHTEWSEGQLLS